MFGGGTTTSIIQVAKAAISKTTTTWATIATIRTVHLQADRVIQAVAAVVQVVAAVVQVVAAVVQAVAGAVEGVVAAVGGVEATYPSSTIWVSRARCMASSVVNQNVGVSPKSLSHC